MHPFVCTSVYSQYGDYHLVCNVVKFNTLVLYCHIIFYSNTTKLGTCYFRLFVNTTYYYYDNNMYVCCCIVIYIYSSTVYIRCTNISVVNWQRGFVLSINSICFRRDIFV